MPLAITAPRLPKLFPWTEESRTKRGLGFRGSPFHSTNHCKTHTHICLITFWWRQRGSLCTGFCCDCSCCPRVCKICWECWVSSHLKGLKRWRTPVRILDVQFYCYRKHLGQMLPCSELTCTFQTGQSFPISAWEQRASRRERERDY